MCLNGRFLRLTHYLLHLLHLILPCIKRRRVCCHTLYKNNAYHFSIPTISTHPPLQTTKQTKTEPTRKELRRASLIYIRSYSYFDFKPPYKPYLIWSDLATTFCLVYVSYLLIYGYSEFLHLSL